MTRKQKLTLCIIAVILGLGIALYPLIYNFYTEKTRSVIVTKYTKAVEMMQGTLSGRKVWTAGRLIRHIVLI